MPQRTKEEINRQIKGLKDMKDKLPEYSSFGDNNWEKIDAQLDILEGEKTPDDFWDASDEYGGNDLYFAAEEADNWLSGYDIPDLFE